MLHWYHSLKLSICSAAYALYINVRYSHITWGRNIKIFGGIDIHFDKTSKVSIGDNVQFRSATKYNFVGIYKRASIAVDRNAELCIGDNTGFSGTSIFVANKVIIGKYCNFGGNTALWDTDFHPLDHEARRVHNRSMILTAPIIIGDDVFIGANTIILKGITIGNRAIIGAGSVVTKNIPDDEIWAGNPAKYIRKINE